MVYVWGGVNSARAFRFSLLGWTPPWIHDGLNSSSHCRRIHIYSAWISGYVLRSIQTQDTSITNPLPQFWRRQWHHPSILNNMLGSICLGNSAFTSGRLQGHHTAQRAFVQTQKILGILFQCFIHGDLPKTCFKVQIRKIPNPYETLNGLLYTGQWIRSFLVLVFNLQKSIQKCRPPSFFLNA